MVGSAILPQGELCAEKHISVTVRKEEELIAALMARGPELESKMLDASSAATGPSSAELFELILTMQRQQMAWMEGQQKWQEEWMHLQQVSQYEMLESMRKQQERGRVAAEEACRTAKLPKPVCCRNSPRRMMWRSTSTCSNVLHPNRSGLRRHGLCSWLDCSGVML